MPASAKTWGSAFQALSEVAKIYVVGFSMSPYDTMARFHFSTALRSRQEPRRKTVLVDPNAVGLATDFRRVFGDTPELVPRPAEEVDWGQLLA